MAFYLRHPFANVEELLVEFEIFEPFFRNPLLVLQRDLIHLVSMLTNLSVNNFERVRREKNLGDCPSAGTLYDHVREAIHQYNNNTWFFLTKYGYVIIKPEQNIIRNINAQVERVCHPQSTSDLARRVTSLHNDRRNERHRVAELLFDRGGAMALRASRAAHSTRRRRPNRSRPANPVARQREAIETVPFAQAAQMEIKQEPVEPCMSAIKVEPFVLIEETETSVRLNDFDPSMFVNDTEMCLPVNADDNVAPVEFEQFEIELGDSTDLHTADFDLIEILDQ